MSDITTFSELVDKLITVNIKLYNVMEVTGTLANKDTRTDADMNKLAN